MSMTLEHAKKHRAQLLEMVQFTDDEIARLEKEQAKPTLRTGDYGGNGAGFWIQLRIGPRWDAGHEASLREPANTPGGKLVLGNIVDDLKMLAEDRTEYTLGDLKLMQEAKGQTLRLRDVWMHLTDENAIALARALRQIIATAERRAAK